MSSIGKVLRALADKTDWKGDEGPRQEVYEALKELDPQSDKQDGEKGAQAPAQSDRAPAKATAGPAAKRH